MVHMRLEGSIALSLLEINPNKYKEFMELENGEQILYVQLKNALYGTLQAAMLFWQDLNGKPLGGFELNPYDNCAANKIIDGKQYRVWWNVDDLKISNVDEKVVEYTAEKLDKVYDKETPLLMNRGYNHEYLGMTLDYSVDGKCKINMQGYIDELIEEYLPDGGSIVSTPTVVH
jgi:hypothetical protein